VPPMCSLWYLMVSGSVVPAIASGGNITVPLLRSDIGGANVAYPVEVMYVEGRRNQSLRFSLPTTDVDTSAMEVKLAVPAGFFADDARGSNPGFDYLGSAPWKVAFPTLRSVGSTSSVHGQSEYSNGILAATSAVAGQGQGQGQCQGQGQGQGNVRFTDTKGGKAGSADVNIYQASAPASSFDGLAVSKVSTVNLSSPSTEVALQAGQYFATWGDQTLNFQVGAQMDQQIILGSSSGGSGLDLLPAGLNFPGKGTVLMFTKILTNANESLFLTLEERSPSASRPAYILVGLGILAIAIAAIAAVAFQKSRSKGVAYAKANVPSSSTVKPKKKHVRRVENHIGATEGSALATEGSASVEGHFEERSKEYKNP